MMTFEEYQAFKDRGFSHAPLIKKRLMDAQTPVSVFSKVRDLNGSAYLFESVVGGERWARYSMIGLGSDLILQYADGHMTVKDNDNIDVNAVEDPFDYIRKLMAQYKMPTAEDIATLPSFSGGLVGYFGYDMVRVIEPSVGLSDAPNPISMPDMWLMLSMSVIVFDSLENTLSIIVYADCNTEDGYSNAIRELEKIEDKLAEMPNLSAPVMPTPTFTSQTALEAYSNDVNKIKDYISAGDVMQVVPAQRLTADYTGDSLAVYRALRFLNPSPYLFLVHGYTLDDHKRFDIIGASPEILSRVEDSKVTVRPLAGTRKRGRDTAEDLALEQELLNDEKEIAQHQMLIDLGSNDIGRVCEHGSVEVTEKMFIERYSQVMHLASNVEGTILPDKDALDVFCATFPAGTLSGIPKIRAMQIIDEIEPVRRTVFGGAVGYLGWHGNMDTAIAIRTAVRRRGKIHIQAGAGIVADSVPETEWDETHKKALALIKAVKMACNGLRIR
ncbi:anthranilate synthase component I family protein [Psychrobacter sp. AOP22-C1-22]|uniref:anthranilate synthase component I family protein n=1 Tax=unclassified Psychrobacter TaxID=196806 RepID=UPI001787AD6D|nr:MULTISPECIES: chorismate-binding protein [unclassified Psychrobacter]MDN5801548.1 chorismate-binding protein [Psychrobacter sp.]MBE0407493.1 chorismate-binding protein [Psychrobacter sp. FME6]MBE0445815.1 chorismate-binding protein [Psychrobacter sp. FME5]MDN5891066.1 chorismate-binding protein [Psychrobacter sp.]MDN5897256.1 chorismate-binding protein [Psychrobacter sp.]